MDSDVIYWQVMVKYDQEHRRALEIFQYLTSCIILTPIHTLTQLSIPILTQTQVLTWKLKSYLILTFSTGLSLTNSNLCHSLEPSFWPSSWLQILTQATTHTSTNLNSDCWLKPWTPNHKPVSALTQTLDVTIASVPNVTPFATQTLVSISVIFQEFHTYILPHEPISNSHPTSILTFWTQSQSYSHSKPNFYLKYLPHFLSNFSPPPLHQLYTLLWSLFYKTCKMKSTNFQSRWHSR